MQELTPEGRRIIDDVARRHGVSTQAVESLLMAISAGQGTQAQFNHPDLGGMGQWSQGGMIMIGDMFNNNLKYRVDGLCNELANLWRSTSMYSPMTYGTQNQSQSQNGSSGTSLFVPGSSSYGNWWPADLGFPSSSGAQNNMRYAVFPSTRRLAIQNNGQTTIYDIGDHNIGGFSQQQGGDQSLTFTSQFGLVRVADLVQVSPSTGNNNNNSNNNTGSFNQPAAQQQSYTQPAPLPQQDTQTFAPAPQWTPAPEPAPAQSFDPLPPVQNTPTNQGNSITTSSHDIFVKIERLAELRQKGILTDDEFAAKKTELLSRL